jgi:hypothetical protein
MPKWQHGKCERTKSTSALTVIERTFAWTSQCRRLARDHEATPGSAVASCPRRRRHPAQAIGKGVMKWVLRSRRSGNGPLKFHPDDSMGAGHSRPGPVTGGAGLRPPDVPTVAHEQPSLSRGAAQACCGPQRAQPRRRCPTSAAHRSAAAARRPGPPPTLGLGRHLVELQRIGVSSGGFLPDRSSCAAPSGSPRVW